MEKKKNFKSVKGNAFDDPKLMLVGEPWVEGGMNRPNASLRVIDSSENKSAKTSKKTSVGIWITAYPNHPDEDEKSARVDVKLNYVYANVFLDTLMAAVEDPEFTGSIGSAAKVWAYNAPDKSGPPPVSAVAHVTKNANGEICLVIVEKDRPKMVFPFRPDPYFGLVDMGGKSLPPAKVSKHLVRGWVAAMRGLLPLVYKDVYENKERERANREKSEGSGQSGGRYNNYNRSNDNDEDVDLFGGL